MALEDRSYSASSFDDEEEHPKAAVDHRSCEKTSYPHIFQLYMFSNNLLTPGHFGISTSNKYYWQRVSDSHNIPLQALNAQLSDLNRCVLWYMLIPKLLWIIPWICLPVGIVIYAVEDGFSHAHPSASEAELAYHLQWSYNGLFIFVGGGIGGVLLATQLWNHCWYLCIQAMANKIHALNSDELWFAKHCVNFDIQCDIPVLAGRSYGRAYYKIVISMHHEYLHDTEARPSQNAKDSLSECVENIDDIKSGLQDAMDASEATTIGGAKTSNKQFLGVNESSVLTEKPTAQTSLFNKGGFVSKSVLTDKGTRTVVKQK